MVENVKYTTNTPQHSDIYRLVSGLCVTVSHFAWFQFLTPIQRFCSQQVNTHVDLLMLSVSGNKQSNTVTISWKADVPCVVKAEKTLETFRAT